MCLSKQRTFYSYIYSYILFFLKHFFIYTWLYNTCYIILEKLYMILYVVGLVLISHFYHKIKKNSYYNMISLTLTANPMAFTSEF
jgi:hypothetical protein